MNSNILPLFLCDLPFLKEGWSVNRFTNLKGVSWYALRRIYGIFNKFKPDCTEIRYVFFFPASPLSGRFPFSRFPFQSLIFTPKSLLFTPISRATWDYTYGTTCGVLGGVGWGSCVARRSMRPRLWCYPSLQFNLLS